MHPGDDVGVEQIEDLLLVELGDRSAVHVPGVVDERVEPPTAVLDGAGDHRRPIAGRRHIADDRPARLTDLLGDRVHLVRPSSRDRHSRAQPGEMAGDAFAQAGPPAGHQDGHALDRPHHASSSTQLSPWVTIRLLSGWASDCRVVAEDQSDHPAGAVAVGPHDRLIVVRRLPLGDRQHVDAGLPGEVSVHLVARARA